MNDTSIKAFVNELNLKCPHCGGRVKVNNITAAGISLDHFLNIPGEKITSNLAACAAMDKEVTALVTSFKNNLMQLPTLREKLTLLTAPMAGPAAPAADITDSGWS